MAAKRAAQQADPQPTVGIADAGESPRRSARPKRAAAAQGYAQFLAADTVAISQNDAKDAMGLGIVRRGRDRRLGGRPGLRSGDPAAGRTGRDP